MRRASLRPAARGALATLALAAAIAATGCGRPEGRSALAGAASARHVVTLAAGDLRVELRDDARSPDLLSGISRLVHAADAPDANAFDDRIPRASTGWNLEHVTGGRSDEHALFSPRHGASTLRALPGGRSAVLSRSADDDPWRMASTTTYTVVAPHALDIEFRCRFEDPSRFEPYGWAMLFWANYMRPAPDFAWHAPGVVAEDPAALDGAAEQWLPLTAPNVHPDWANGGTYRARRAEPLDHDEGHPATFVLWSYDVPRLTQPVFYGLAPDGMVLLVMFDRLWSEEDEVRLSLFSFKDDVPKPPARDLQYVVHRVQAGREYGYRARMVWKRFAGEQDCLHEYARWRAELDLVATPAPGRR